MEENIHPKSGEKEETRQWGTRTCPVGAVGPSTVEPIAGQTLPSSTDFLQGQRMGQSHDRVKLLTSNQGCSTPHTHPAKPRCEAFCQALGGIQRASFPRLGSLASRHTGAPEEAGGKERYGSTLRSLQVLGDKSPALSPQSQHTSCCYFAGDPTASGQELAVGRLPSYPDKCKKDVMNIKALQASA